MKKFIYSALTLAVAVLSFTSCEDVPEQYQIPTSPTNKIAPEGKGTLASPYNVTAADSIITAGSYTSDMVYIKGVITSTSDFNASFGNITYNISDAVKGAVNLEVYRGLNFNSGKFASEEDLALGDTVVICGAITNYNGTHEVTQGSYLVSLNGKTSSTPSTPTASGTGTKTDPYNIAKVLDLYSNNSYDSNTDVYVKGIVSKVGSVDTTTYYNATYYLSDDGSSTNSFEIYRGMYINGAKFTSASQLKVGQTVVVCGKLTAYKTTNEMGQGSQIISIDGNGSNTGGNTPSTGSGVSINGTTVSLLNSAATIGTATATIDLNAVGLVDKAPVTSVSLSDGSTVTFNTAKGTNAPVFYSATKGVRVYANNSITFAGKAKIAKIVFTCDSYNGTDYVGNTTATVTFDGNNAVYTNASTTAGTQLRVQTITVYYAK